MKQSDFYQAKLDYEIDSYDLKKSIDAGDKVKVLDVRSKESFDLIRIAVAESMPYRQINEETTRTMDKETTYVTYCDGQGCNASTKGALALSKLGFKVKELIGGLEWWASDGYDIIQAEGHENCDDPECGCE